MRVVVIGGGVVGLACGYELLRRGAEVTLIDQGDFGEAASWGNAGWITPSFSTPLPAPGLVQASIGMMLRPDSPLYIKPNLDPAFLRWMLAFMRYCNASAYRTGMAALAELNRRTYDLYDDLAHTIPFEIHRDGILFAFATPEGMHHVLQDLEAMAAYGYPMPQILSVAEARQLEPALIGDIVGAVLAAQERHVLPSSLTSALAERLRAGGAALHPWTEVHGIGTRNGSVTHVETSSGSISADVFVLAAGAWSSRLAKSAGFRLPVEAGKGYSIHISNPTLKLQRPLYLAETKVAACPFDSALRIAGTMELSGINTRLDRRRIAGIRSGISAFLPESWEEGEATREWVGMRPMLPDGLPAIGSAPRLKNLFVGTAHGMLGVTLAPVTAVALADLICDGRSDIDVRPFNPGRFDR